MIVSGRGVRRSPKMSVAIFTLEHRLSAQCASNEGDDKQYQENQKQNFGEACSETGEPEETEIACDDRKQKEK